MNETTSGIRASLLIYDIPDKSNFPNPSSYLRRRAIRINLSAWVVPEGNEPSALLDRMTQAGVLWEIVKFDPSDADKLLMVCISSLKADIRNAMSRAGRSVGIAQEKASEGLDARKECRLYAKRTGGVVRRLTNLLKDFRTVADTFGIDPDRVLSLAEARTAVDALSASVKTRADLYAKAVAECADLATVDSVAMANAARQDQVPALILADFLDEHGGNGAPLREAFMPTAV